MGPPQTPSRMMQASPNLFPSLQYSPDLFANSPFGANTAPAYPQQRLFWDPASAFPEENAPTTFFQDNFSMTEDEFSNSFRSSSTVVPSFSAAETLPETQPYDLPTAPRFPNSSFIDGAAFPAPFTTSPRVVPQHRDNPTLFLSSPARRFGGPNPAATTVSKNIVRDMPAYHHQIEESRREKEKQRVRRTVSTRTKDADFHAQLPRRPISPLKDNRPNLKRSSTHAGILQEHHLLRRRSDASLTDSASRTSASSARSLRQGRSSPLKNARDAIPRSLLSARPLSRNRMSLALAVDDQGVARTVVTKLQEESEHEMDMDEQSSQSAASSFDQEDFNMLHSQNNSFAFSDHDSYARSTQQPPTRTSIHSKNSSYSSIVTSSNSAKPSSRTSSANSGFNFRSGDATVRRRRFNDGEDTIMEERPGNGDAQQALRAIIQAKSASTFVQDDSASARQSGSSTQFNSSPPMPHGRFSHFNASPTPLTDPELATPNSDRESLFGNGSTRCICNSTLTSGYLMIQWYVPLFSLFQTVLNLPSAIHVRNGYMRIVSV